MTCLPEFEVGLINGWLPLVIYLAGFLLAVASFSKAARERLFEDPKYSMPTGIKIVRQIGQLGMIAFIGMMVFTPLKLGTPVFIIGVLIYLLGYALLISALSSFRKTPENQAVVAGSYRWSRNPQWVGLMFVFFGAALMVGVALYLGILLLIAIIYHLQILGEEKLCLEQYGDEYRTYMESVPRYFLFL